MKILMVLTSHDKLGDTGRKTPTHTRESLELLGRFMVSVFWNCFALTFHRYF
jgi:hypothetical protein